jgi:hypothetical protein
MAILLGEDEDGEMTERARDTAYYLNGKLPILALVAQGVRFPRGRWIRVASEMVSPSLVQELVIDLFPALRERPLRIVDLLTDFDVQEFELVLEDTEAPAGVHEG